MLVRLARTTLVLSAIAALLLLLSTCGILVGRALAVTIILILLICHFCILL
ncbi:MAG: hypothetical protein AB7G25_13110 [Sphingomonadaceae bacterium]